jgi:hypothetical protein
MPCKKNCRKSLLANQRNKTSNGAISKSGTLFLKLIDNKRLVIDKQRYDQFSKWAEEMKKRE